MKRLILISIFIISIVCLYAQTGEIKVMTYNILNDRLTPPEMPYANWGNRLPAVVELIKEVNPDIFGLQEGRTSQVKGIHSSLLDYSWYGDSTSIHLGNPDQMGCHNAIFYKKDFTLLKWGDFSLSPTFSTPSAGWNDWQQRMCTWIKLRDKKGFIFFVFNAHLCSATSNDNARTNSVGLILSRIEAINENNDPVIVMGDFNCDYTKDAYKIITSTCKFEDSIDMASNKENAASSTYGGFFSWSGDGKGGGRIDHIFVSEAHFNVEKYSIWKKMYEMKDFPLNAIGERKNHPSDHYPVIAQLKYVK